MKKVKKIILALSLMLIMVAVIPTFFPGSVNRITVVEAASNVKLSKTKVTLIKGQKLQLKLKGTSKKVRWSTSKKSVATVSSDGKITARNKGKAVVTAKIGKKKYKCKIIVEEPKISKKSIVLKKGEIYNLKIVGTTQKISWTSNKKSIATVSNKGTVTAKQPGKTTIIAKVNNKKFSCKVTVEEIKYGTISGNITYLYNYYRGHVGDTGAKVILIPMNGKAKNVNFNLYTSSDELEKYHVYIAKVDGTGQYNINHVAEGKYKVLIISHETTEEEWFNIYDESISDVPEWYYDDIASCFYTEYLNKKTAKNIAKEVMFYKYYITTINIYENENTTLSYDFGITYI